MASASGHVSVCSDFCASSDACTACGARVNTAWKPSPMVLTTIPHGARCNRAGSRRGAPAALHGLALDFPQPRAALDVGEQECQRAARKRIHRCAESMSDMSVGTGRQSKPAHAGRVADRYCGLQIDARATFGAGHQVMPGRFRGNDLSRTQPWSMPPCPANIAEMAQRVNRPEHPASAHCAIAGPCDVASTRLAPGCLAPTLPGGPPQAPATRRRSTRARSPTSPRS